MALTDMHPGSRHPSYRLGAAALVLAAATILGALAFEYVGGYRPCPLCLEQRWAYYAGIPVLFLALVAYSANKPGVAALLFLLVSLGFLYNAGLGTYHAGAEWKFWPGPDTCSDQLTSLSKPGGGGVLGSLGKTQVIRCDEAAWRMFGISFAGYNVIISLALMLLTLRAALSLRSRG